MQRSQSHLARAEAEKIDEFILGEELGTQSTPKCGNCRCGKCPLPGHTFSFREEAELKVIRDNLKYDEDLQCWKTSYPWKKDPMSLPENEFAVRSTLRNLQSKLRKDDSLAAIYKEQMEDMLKRGVAREGIDAGRQGSLKVASLKLEIPNELSSSPVYGIAPSSC